MNKKLRNIFVIILIISIINKKSKVSTKPKKSKDEKVIQQTRLTKLEPMFYGKKEFIDKPKLRKR